jgi:hypothetical protein
MLIQESVAAGTVCMDKTSCMAARFPFFSTASKMLVKRLFGHGISSPFDDLLSQTLLCTAPFDAKSSSSLGT